jgi:hypothetical protein
MYWNNGTGEACYDSIGMNASYTSFYLPDGDTSNGREAWTLVQNPNTTDATVEISYLTPNGQGNVIKTHSRKLPTVVQHARTLGNQREGRCQGGIQDLG